MRRKKKPTDIRSINRDALDQTVPNIARVATVVGLTTSFLLAFFQLNGADWLMNTWYGADNVSQDFDDSTISTIKNKIYGAFLVLFLAFSAGVAVPVGRKTHRYLVSQIPYHARRIALLDIVQLQNYLGTKLGSVLDQTRRLFGHNYAYLLALTLNAADRFGLSAAQLQEVGFHREHEDDFPLFLEPPSLDLVSSVASEASESRQSSSVSAVAHSFVPVPAQMQRPTYVGELIQRQQGTGELQEGEGFSHAAAGHEPPLFTVLVETLQKKLKTLNKTPQGLRPLHFKKEMAKSILLNELGQKEARIFHIPKEWRIYPTEHNNLDWQASGVLQNLEKLYNNDYQFSVLVEELAKANDTNQYTALLTEAIIHSINKFIQDPSRYQDNERTQNFLIHCIHLFCLVAVAKEKISALKETIGQLDRLLVENAGCYSRSSGIDVIHHWRSVIFDLNPVLLVAVPSPLAMSTRSVVAPSPDPTVSAPRRHRSASTQSFSEHSQNPLEAELYLLLPDADVYVRVLESLRIRLIQNEASATVWADLVRQIVSDKTRSRSEAEEWRQKFYFLSKLLRPLDQKERQKYPKALMPDMRKIYPLLSDLYFSDLTSTNLQALDWLREAWKPFLFFAVGDCEIHFIDHISEEALYELPVPSLVLSRDTEVFKVFYRSTRQKIREIPLSRITGLERALKGKYDDLFTETEKKDITTILQRWYEHQVKPFFGMRLFLYYALPKHIQAYGLISPVQYQLLQALCQNVSLENLLMICPADVLKTMLAQLLRSSSTVEQAQLAYRLLLKVFSSDVAEDVHWEFKCFLDDFFASKTHKIHYMLLLKSVSQIKVENLKQMQLSSNPEERDRGFQWSKQLDASYRLATVLMSGFYQLGEKNLGDGERWARKIYKICATFLLPIAVSGARKSLFELDFIPAGLENHVIFLVAEILFQLRPYFETVIALPSSENAQLNELWMKNTELKELKESQHRVSEARQADFNRAIGKCSKEIEKISDEHKKYYGDQYYSILSHLIMFLFSEPVESMPTARQLSGMGLLIDLTKKQETRYCAEAIKKVAARIDVQKLFGLAKENRWLDEEDSDAIFALREIIQEGLLENTVITAQHCENLYKIVKEIYPEYLKTPLCDGLGEVYQRIRELNLLPRNNPLSLKEFKKRVALAMLFDFQENPKTKAYCAYSALHYFLGLEEVERFQFKEIVLFSNRINQTILNPWCALLSVVIDDLGRGVLFERIRTIRENAWFFRAIVQRSVSIAGNSDCLRYWQQETSALKTSALYWRRLKLYYDGLELKAEYWQDLLSFVHYQFSLEDANKIEEGWALLLSAFLHSDVEQSVLSIHYFNFLEKIRDFSQFLPAESMALTKLKALHQDIELNSKKMTEIVYDQCCRNALSSANQNMLLWQLLTFLSDNQLRTFSDFQSEDVLQVVSNFTRPETYQSPTNLPYLPKWQSNLLLTHLRNRGFRLSARRFNDQVKQEIADAIQNIELVFVHREFIESELRCDFLQNLETLDDAAFNQLKTNIMEDENHLLSGVGKGKLERVLDEVRAYSWVDDQLENRARILYLALNRDRLSQEQLIEWVWNACQYLQKNYDKNFDDLSPAHHSAFCALLSREGVARIQQVNHGVLGNFNVDWLLLQNTLKFLKQNRSSLKTVHGLTLDFREFFVIGYQQTLSLLKPIFDNNQIEGVAPQVTAQLLNRQSIPCEEGLLSFDVKIGSERQAYQVSVVRLENMRLALLERPRMAEENTDKLLLKALFDFWVLTLTHLVKLVSLHPEEESYQKMLVATLRKSFQDLRFYALFPESNLRLETEQGLKRYETIEMHKRLIDNELSRLSGFGLLSVSLFSLRHFFDHSPYSGENVNIALCILTQLSRDYFARELPGLANSVFQYMQTPDLDSRVLSAMRAKLLQFANTFEIDDFVLWADGMGLSKNYWVAAKMYQLYNEDRRRCLGCFFGAGQALEVLWLHYTGVQQLQFNKVNDLENGGLFAAFKVLGIEADYSAISVRYDNFLRTQGRFIERRLPVSGSGEGLQERLLQ